MKEDPANKVSVERCATLMGIAIANKLSEVWICKPLILQLVYLGIYYPNIGLWYVTLDLPKFPFRYFIKLFYVLG